MNALARLVRDELDATGWWQKDVAAAVGCTPKHLSQLLTGHQPMTEEWAVRILAVFGRRLVVASAPKWRVVEGK